ncbi:MAG TPA: hypothetical protein VEI01_17360 [Terriglobales bacterium]|nr:hypothetical protein [Terriglobales bacterium]
MVKHSVAPSSPFFMHERFGKPQLIAGTLLLVFLGQCAWLVSRSLGSGQWDESEWYRIDTGLRIWHGTTAPRETAPAQPRPGTPARVRENDGIDPDHSQLWYLVSSLPLLVWPGSLHSTSLSYWGWLARGPGMWFGLWLGASLWYVARRLYGNEGGFVALTLYCFSPGMIRASSGGFAEPQTGAAWGAFGAVFTAIALAHTLYAPREVVLWNWRRIALLAIALALAVGSQYVLVVLAPLTLGFVLYLAPTRRAAAAVIWGAACALALAILFAAYGFRPTAFREALTHAAWLSVPWKALAMAGIGGEGLARIRQTNPALLVALAVTLVTFLAWRRARYFGNWAPLLVGGLFLLLGLTNPSYPEGSFGFVALPFLFVFVGGVMADLRETRYRKLVSVGLFCLLFGYALWSVMELSRQAGNVSQPLIGFRVAGAIMHAGGCAQHQGNDPDGRQFLSGCQKQELNPAAEPKVRPRHLTVREGFHARRTGVSSWNAVLDGAFGCYLGTVPDACADGAGQRRSSLGDFVWLWRASWMAGRSPLRDLLWLWRPAGISWRPAGCNVPRTAGIQRGARPAWYGSPPRLSPSPASP